MDFLIIFILVLYGFYRYRLERQKTFEEELFQRTRRRYGNLDIGKS